MLYRTTSSVISPLKILPRVTDGLGGVAVLATSIPLAMYIDALSTPVPVSLEYLTTTASYLALPCDPFSIAKVSLEFCGIEKCRPWLIRSPLPIVISLFEFRV